MSQYFPSIVFLFIDSSGVRYPRRAQIKTRLTAVEGRAVSEEKINELCGRVLRLRGFSYVAGASRCTFVSSHSSRWRTTIFCESPKEGKSVLSKVLEVLGEELNDSCVTHTTPRVRKRESLPIGSAEIKRRFSNQDLSRPTNMQLKRAVLYCRGYSPINLFQGL